MKLDQFLFKPIPNTALVVFRWFFGFLIAAETFGAILTGWVRRVLVEPQFTFSFIDFPWLQPLPGNGMYFYFALMGLLGIMVMLGYRYRMAMLGFALLWTGVYFMQKSSYNNHYYLLVLLTWMMCLLPAHRRASLDVRQEPSLHSFFMPHWCQIVLIAQVAIAYTYGAVAKLYPHWMDGTFIERAFTGRYRETIFSALFDERWFHLFISYSGFLFDLLVVPLLLWRKTRTVTFIAAIFFHLFNSVVFQIGIFPYLSLAFCLFFFPTEKIRRLFLPKSTTPNAKPNLYRRAAWFYPLIGSYFVLQLLLPLRHHLIESNVFWTEEGHRMSWRMMLRSKSGSASFWVRPQGEKHKQRVVLHEYLSPKQQRKVATHPDMIWQMAQRLRREYNAQGDTVEVYVSAHVSLNGKPYAPLINPEVDMARAKWNRWSHQDWIMPFPGYYPKKEH